MNCGLSNYATLAGFILPNSMQTNTSYQVKLQAIGLLVADAFDVFCNRKFAWEENATDVFSGDRPQWYVERYPIATIPNTPNQAPQITSVNMRYFLTDNWTNIVGEPLQVDAWKGKIHFGYTLGRAPLQVQVVYNGGYYFNFADTFDAGYTEPTPQVAGSVALPPGLQSAFLIQTQEVWNKMDKLGAGIADKPDQQSNLGALKLSPMIEQMLRQYIRYQMT